MEPRIDLPGATVVGTHDNGDDDQRHNNDHTSTGIVGRASLAPWLHPATPPLAPLGGISSTSTSTNTSLSNNAVEAHPPCVCCICLVCFQSRVQRPSLLLQSTSIVASLALLLHTRWSMVRLTCVVWPTTSMPINHMEGDEVRLSIVPDSPWHRGCPCAWHHWRA